MDKLFIKGLTEIFLAITTSVIKNFNISLKTSHLDSTSLHLHGSYNTGLPDVIIEDIAILIELQTWYILSYFRKIKFLMTGYKLKEPLNNWE